MPELPEVETVMRGLEPALLGRIITRVDQRRPDLRIPFPKDLKKRLENKKILSLKRRAKYILINLEGGDVLVIHLGMSGRVLITDDKAYEPEKHDHFIIETNKKTKIVYNDARRFGMIFLVKENSLSTHKAFKDMGPEPLGNDFSAPVLKERLKGKKTSIKQALLDQRVVVGLGNIYVCEALYESGIHPKAQAGRISLSRLEILTNNIQSVLKKAIEAGGSSLKDYRQADGELGYFQHSFKVYDQEGNKCRNCKGEHRIKRIVQSGRSTFFCSSCQKR